MKSVWIAYMVILVYYLLGTAGIWIINQKKESEVRRKAWIKHVTYFLITSILFFSIAIRVEAFRIIAIVIVVAGLAELIKLFRESGYRHRNFFLISVFMLAALSAGFFFFSRMEQGLILYSFLILCIFDGFSQVTGQLIGRHKLLPKISPNKTVEGLIGGATVALLSALVFRQLIPAEPVKAISVAAVVAVFAFAGDTAKSAYKRRYNVKDFSRLIPGHGGFLDRFDSLIAGGAGVALLDWLLTLQAL